MAELCPAAMMRGFSEGTRHYGVLLDHLEVAVLNRFCYAAVRRASSSSRRLLRPHDLLASPLQLLRDGADRRLFAQAAEWTGLPAGEILRGSSPISVGATPSTTWAGVRRTVFAGGLVGAIGMAWLTGLDATDSPVEIGERLFLVGLGLGPSTGPLPAAALTAVDHCQSGMASAMISMLRFLGGMAGTTILSLALGANADSLARHHVALWIFVAAFVASSACALGLRPLIVRPSTLSRPVPGSAPDARRHRGVTPSRTSVSAWSPQRAPPASS